MKWIFFVAYVVVPFLAVGWVAASAFAAEPYAGCKADQPIEQCRPVARPEKEGK